MSQGRPAPPHRLTRKSRYVIDARGLEVPLPSFSLIRRRAGTAYGRLSTQSGTRRWVPIGLVALLLASWLIAVILKLTKPTDWIDEVLGILTLVVLALIPVWIGLREKRSPLLVSQLLQARICPHCAYDLSGLAEPETPRSERTTVTCPECACVWCIGPTD